VSAKSAVITKALKWKALQTNNGFAGAVKARAGILVWLLFFHIANTPFFLYTDLVPGINTW
jgi:hypothetical protein